MSFILPIIAAGGAIAALAFGGKKKQPQSAIPEDSGFDETSLFAEKTPETVAPTASTTPASTPAPAAQTTTTTATSTSSSSASTASSGPYKNFPLVLFSQSKVGSFDPTEFVSKVSAALVSRKLTDLQAVYKTFMALNNDQIRFLHNRFYTAKKKTLYQTIKPVKLSVGQYVIGDILGKLNVAGVGEVPKEKI